MNSNNIILEEATTKDFKQLKQIGMTCYDVTVDPKRENFIARLLFMRYFSKGKFKNRQRLEDVLIMNLKKNDEIIGFYELETNGNLASLYVLPNHHKKGYGKVLLGDALDKAKQMKLSQITLEASRYAHDFYLHLGFKDSQKARVMLGVWMVAMKKEIL